MAGRRKKNVITDIAEADGRNYITPEDITRALMNGEKNEHIWYDTLAVLANITKFGWEDASLCAFIAWEGSRAKNQLED